jgi:acyl-CoA thioester hydrolase
MGVAYHGHYLAWYEMGRTELMRQLGCAYADVERREKIFFPVVEAGSRYLTPARYDDELEVRTRLAHVGGARVRFEYELIRGADQRLLATGFTEHASVGSTGRPVRLPAGLRAKLKSGLAPAGAGSPAGPGEAEGKRESRGVPRERSS